MVKKILKICLKVLGAILLVDLVAVVIFCIYNGIQYSKEEKLLDRYPGQLVEVNGHNMNVVVEGEGAHTLVFLAPSQDTSPAFTFKPLYSELSDEYRTVVVEKFGYGRSDIVDTPRDYQTMVDECRAALTAAGVEAP
ncbi:MAG: alpha/beta hydrolase, partial [Oscillospiraceae bacterium]|nr:alpha/beta hydrolase [Oscillospiraceae bacterium]